MNRGKMGKGLLFFNRALNGLLGSKFQFYNSMVQ
jgi:hypothetical protein